MPATRLGTTLIARSSKATVPVARTARESVPRTGGPPPHAEVLHQPRIDLHAAGCAGVVRVLRHQLHIHERRFPRLIEMPVGLHRVVPVQNLSACGVACRRGGRQRAVRDEIGDGRAEQEGDADGERDMEIAHDQCSSPFGYAKRSIAQDWPSASSKVV
jgi:hypothetical protein